jgi:hypothetical protein
MVLRIYQTQQTESLKCYMKNQLTLSNLVWDPLDQHYENYLSRYPKVLKRHGVAKAIALILLIMS